MKIRVIYKFDGQTGRLFLTVRRVDFFDGQTGRLFLTVRRADVFDGQTGRLFWRADLFLAVVVEMDSICDRFLQIYGSWTVAGLSQTCNCHEFATNFSLILYDGAKLRIIMHIIVESAVFFYIFYNTSAKIREALVCFSYLLSRKSRDAKFQPQFEIIQATIWPPIRLTVHSSIRLTLYSSIRLFVHSSIRSFVYSSIRLKMSWKFIKNRGLATWCSGAGKDV